MRSLETLLDRINQTVGRVAAILLLLLLLNVAYDVVARYLFNAVSIGLQELEWHLYATVFLLGISYTLSQDGHVRVDLLYDRLPPRRQALIDLLGTLVLLIPFTLLIIWYGSGFVAESYRLGETSGDPGGLPYRWIIKAVIPIAFTTLLLSAIAQLLRCWCRITSSSAP